MILLKKHKQNNQSLITELAKRYRKAPISSVVMVGLYYEMAGLLSEVRNIQNSIRDDIYAKAQAEQA